jgi:hypothetical protein
LKKQGPDFCGDLENQQRRAISKGEDSRAAETFVLEQIPAMLEMNEVEARNTVIVIATAMRKSRSASV